MLSRQVLYTRATPPPLFVLVFWMILLYTGARLVYNPPIYASLIAGMTDMGHCTQPLVEMKSHKLFALAGLEPQSS
jgi:hypothetical protein